MSHAGTAARSARRPQLPVLTSLRFWAAIYVVLFHLSPVTTYPHPIDRIIDQGRAGVAFFFVLSGFILTYNYADWFRADLSRSWRFYQARLARVYPMYLVGLAICAPLTIYFLFNSPAFASRWFGGHVAIADVMVSFIVNLLTLQPFVPVQAYQYYWNSPGWSIGAEFFFYALFPFTARLIVNRLTTVPRLLGVLVALVTVQLAIWLGLTLWIAATFHDQAYHDAMDLFVYKPPILRLPEFLVGCTLGALLLHMLDVPGGGHPLHRLMRSKAYRNAAVGLGILGCILVVFLPTPASLALVLYPMKFYVLFTPLFGLVIFAVACGRTFLHEILEQRWAVVLGEASFSLYILHGSVRMVLLNVSMPTKVPLGGIAILVCAMVGVSLLFYRYFEAPARDFVRGRLSLWSARKRPLMTIAPLTDWNVDRAATVPE